GGMVSTDASGQGSCSYGKTRDHVLALEVVLPGGERFTSRPAGPDELQAQLARPGRVGDAWRCAHRIVERDAALIEQRF
ncbi:FAD-binding protein, partial [Acinetobacter baumannii]